MRENSGLTEVTIEEWLAMDWTVRGFVDARAGLPYRASYETALPKDQGNYEDGRILAIRFPQLKKITAKGKPTPLAILAATVALEEGTIW